VQEKQHEGRSNEPFGTLRDVKYHTLPRYFECTKAAKTNLSDKILIEREWISDDFRVFKSLSLTVFELGVEELKGESCS
jgi:hypothetical protein